MPSHVKTLCRTSVVWTADRCHCQAAEFMVHIYFKVSSKLYIHYLNSAEYTITRKRVFGFHAYKSCLDTATGGLYITLTSQVVMYAPAERAKKFSLSRLSPSLLCGLNLPPFEISSSWPPFLIYYINPSSDMDTEILLVHWNKRQN